MKIRTQLFIGLAVSTLVLGLISLSVIRTNVQVERLSFQEERANNIELSIGELGYLSNDFILFGEDQQARRWESRYAEILEELSGLQVGSPARNALIQTISTNLANLKEVFEDISLKVGVASRNAPGMVGLAEIQVSWSRIGTLIQGLNFEASQLSGSLEAEITRLKQINILLVLILMGAFVAALLLNFLLTMLRTLRSIEKIHAGTRIIGSGDFSYSIEEKLNDEIGELAHGFNVMTANLRLLTASKAELEREINERKKIEKELKESKDESDTLRRIAEKASQAKSEFLAHMSHEIRTPIGGIVGMTDLLHGRLQDPEHRLYLAMIKEAAGSLMSIIGNVLDLSKIEAGKKEISPVDIRVRNEIDKLMNLFMTQASQKNLELSCFVAPGVPGTIHADPAVFQHVLRNLVSNAVKYTDSGSVLITLVAEKREGTTLHLKFAVADTGRGIDRGKQDLLFQSFTRLGSVYSRERETGTGLGLSIARNLVELFGGSIGVQSAPGRGSTFTFTVPVEIAPEETPLVESPPAESRSIMDELAELPKLKLLLAEDNRINVMFLESAFREAGHEVVTVENGQLVEKVLAERFGGGERFDLVLMDVQMPVLDGLAATRQLRTSDAPYRNIPVIALTAFAMAGDIERFKKAGMNGYVSKPVEFRELVGEIRRVLGSADGKNHLEPFPGVNSV